MSLSAAQRRIIEDPNNAVTPAEDWWFLQCQDLLAELDRLQAGVTHRGELLRESLPLVPITWGVLRAAIIAELAEGGDGHA